MRMQAVFNGTVVAESDQTIVVEGNHYFPEESLRKECFTPTRSATICPWKGKASYYTLTVDGVASKDAAWQYRHPVPLARKVKGRVAFWRGVVVQPASDSDERARPSPVRWPRPDSTSWASTPSWSAVSAPTGRASRAR